MVKAAALSHIAIVQGACWQCNACLGPVSHSALPDSQLKLALRDIEVDRLLHRSQFVCIVHAAVAACS